MAKYVFDSNIFINLQRRQPIDIYPSLWSRIGELMDKGTQVGKLYTKAVMSAYHADKLSPREASNYLLGLRVKHFGAIERWCY